MTDEQTQLYCPQCGVDVDYLDEGYCTECSEENRNNLLDHNFAYDRWESLSDQERDDEIKRALL